MFSEASAMRKSEANAFNHLFGWYMQMREGSFQEEGTSLGEVDHGMNFIYGRNLVDGTNGMEPWNISGYT
ncbi:hypothetical protein CEXT_512041 [Caerostris extrusa]|uniref:Uncharacterized protein n=1 Tax=Caerostris extrusa TaxID=172846 RepID=A0AAV4TR42_CAEEX|nr:hypothetical protein CEXT_512041 [Caerostris extrusa]